MSKTIPTSFSQDFTPGNVKAAMAGVGASSGDLWRVPVGDIHVVPGLNVRAHNDEYEAHIVEIGKSILAEGYYQDKPLAVFVDEEGRICLRDGHSRLLAVKWAIEHGAEIATIPCVTAPKGTTMTDIMVGLVKSNTGKPLAPIEVAVVCKRLAGWGWDAKKIAERFDYTEGYVNDLFRLLEAPEALKQLVAGGKVAAGTAIKQIKKEGADKATATLVETSKSTKDGKVSAKHLKQTESTPDIKAALAESAAAKSTGADVEKAPLTEKQLKAVLKKVFDDKNFHMLKDSLQNAIIDIVG